jgi:hypothetical protein
MEREKPTRATLNLLKKISIKKHLYVKIEFLIFKIKGSPCAISRDAQQMGADRMMIMQSPHANLCLVPPNYQNRTAVAVPSLRPALADGGRRSTWFNHPCFERN